MKCKSLIYVLTLTAFLLAGYGTGVAEPHMAAFKQAAIVTFPREAAVLFFSVLNSVSRITEEAGFLVLGCCCISLAWALHRKSVRSR
jgi:hypothetical protein